MAVGGDKRRDAPLDVTIVVTPRFPLHALALCVDALRVANRESGKTLFTWRVAAETGEAVASSAGIEIRPDIGVASIELAPLIVVLAAYEPDTAVGLNLVPWLKRQARRGAFMGCVDTGALVLARAGLVSERSVSVHPDALNGAREDYRNQQFSDRLFSIDGRRFSSAGGVATFDMMLTLIEGIHGRALADRIARVFNHVRRDEADRDGRLDARMSLPPLLARCIEVMSAHIEDPLSLQRLGESTGAPPWTLRRMFKRHCSVTPSVFYRDLRLDRGRQLLAYSHLSVAEIAAACGFAEVASFSRAFSRRFGLAPSRARHDDAGLPAIESRFTDPMVRQDS